MKNIMPPGLPPPSPPQPESAHHSSAPGEGRRAHNGSHADGATTTTSSTTNYGMHRELQPPVRWFGRVDQTRREMYELFSKAEAARSKASERVIGMLQDIWGVAGGGHGGHGVVPGHGHHMHARLADGAGSGIAMGGVAVGVPGSGSALGLSRTPSVTHLGGAGRMGGFADGRRTSSLTAAANSTGLSLASAAMAVNVSDVADELKVLKGHVTQLKEQVRPCLRRHAQGARR